MNADYYIKKFNLLPHLEGGFYRETYRSDIVISGASLPVEFQDSRNASTAILFLLQNNDFSAFHRIASDELWHYHSGKGAIIYSINTNGMLTTYRLSADDHAESQFQVVIPANNWFAAELIDPDDYILTGCTVAPGFDFADFELADREQLINQFPQHKHVITRLTRSDK